MGGGPTTLHTYLRFFRRMSLLGAACLLAAACGGAGGQQSQSLSSSQTLKFPIFDNFGSLDPDQLNAESDSEIAQNVFNGLVKFDSNLNVVPDIATSLPKVSADGLTYTFTLRKDVTFSNGDKVSAKDVLYSWNRGAALAGPYSTSLGAIAGFDTVSTNGKKVADPAKLETMLDAKDPSVAMTGLTAPDGPDGYTVQVKLAQSAGWFLSAIALESTTGMLVDQNAVKKDPAKWWSKPETAIGTGAYKMTGYVEKQSADFQAVPNWWGSPKPVVKKVHIDIISNPGTGVTAYEQGKYDLMGFGGYSSAVPIADLLRIRNNPKEKAQLLIRPKVRSYWVSFNVVSDAKRKAKGPFVGETADAKNLRLAFALAVDKQKLAQVVCQNIVCTPATGGLIPPGLVGYLGDNQDPLAKFDPQKAKQLLKQADPDGSKTRGLAYVYDPESALNSQSAQFLQDQWQTNLGVHVDLTPETHSQFIKDRQAGNFVLSRDGWQADYNHPQDWFDNLWGKAAGCPDSACTSGYDSPAYDEAVAKADSLPLSQAVPQYKKISQMLIDEANYIPLFYAQGTFLIKPYVKGAGSNAFSDYWWNNYQILQH